MKEQIQQVLVARQMNDDEFNNFMKQVANENLLEALEANQENIELEIGQNIVFINNGSENNLKIDTGVIASPIPQEGDVLNINFDNENFIRQCDQTKIFPKDYFLKTIKSLGGTLMK